MGSSAYLEDVSGRPIPISVAASNGVLSVPPVRDAPNEQALELRIEGYLDLAPGTGTFQPLLDPSSSTGVVAAAVPETYVGIIRSVLLFCPDMGAATVPYLFWQLLINGNTARGWGNVTVWPRAGTASVSFDSAIDLPAGGVVGMQAKNTDGVAHFLGVYLYGWMWPKDQAGG